MAKKELKRKMVDICRELYRERLVRGREGNVSAKLNQDTFFITPHGVSLGFIKERDILLVDKQGKVIDGIGEPSFEIGLHKAIYSELKEVEAVIHVHPSFTTLLAEKGLSIQTLTFELEAILTGTEVIPQKGPVITDIDLVINALKKRNIVILKNHGTVAIGNLDDAFFLTDMLEEASKMSFFAHLLRINTQTTYMPSKDMRKEAIYELFSPEHIEILVSSVNQSKEVREEGRETDLTVRIAMKVLDNGQVYNFHFVQGSIVKVSHDEDADFLFTGSMDCWRAIFNGQLDAFVATSQNKLKIKGNLAELSKWYLSFKKIFELWKNFPVF